MFVSKLRINIGEALLWFTEAAAEARAPDALDKWRDANDAGMFTHVNPSPPSTKDTTVGSLATAAAGGPKFIQLPSGG